MQSQILEKPIESYNKGTGGIIMKQNKEKKSIIAYAKGFTDIQMLQDLTKAKFQEPLQVDTSRIYECRAGKYAVE